MYRLSGFRSRTCRVAQQRGERYRRRMSKSESRTIERFFQDTHFWQQRILQTACKLDVFTPLARKALPATEIARKIGADPNATLLLLNALAASGYLQRKGERFANGSIANAHLVRGEAGYLGHFAILDHDSWDLWGALTDAVVSGKTPRRSGLYGDDRSRTYHLLTGLHLLGKKTAPAVARKLKLGRAKRVLDVGGGLGTYSIAVCRAYPDIEATLFDLPLAQEFARHVLASSGVADRIHQRNGDFTSGELGQNYDAVLLFNVLHGLPPDLAGALVARAARATRPGGRVIVRDWILEENGVRPAEGATFSVQLMLESGGRCYKLSEIRDWMTEAGLRSFGVLEKNAMVAATLGG